MRRLRNPDRPQPAVKADDPGSKRSRRFKPEKYQAFDRMQIVTVQEILDSERINLPRMEDVTQKAHKAKSDAQPNLGLE